jgi:hypothetical protein
MALPPVGTLPSPWATWTLVRLVRYRARQLWAHEKLLESRAAQEALSAVETVDYATTSHPLPDLPGWQLDLYGGYELDFAYLRHRPRGEEIFLDLSSVNDGDGYPCMEALIARRDRGPWGAAEARMAGLHPVRDSVLYAREELIELGYLDGYCFDENIKFYGERLSPQAAAVAGAVEGFAEQWEDPTNRLWLAALAGGGHRGGELRGRSPGPVHGGPRRGVPPEASRPAADRVRGVARAACDRLQAWGVTRGEPPRIHRPRGAVIGQAGLGHPPRDGIPRRPR